MEFAKKYIALNILKINTIIISLLVVLGLETAQACSESTAVNISRLAQPPQDTFQLNLQFQLLLHFGAKHQCFMSINSGIGMRWRKENYQQGLSLSVNIYNGGLGTQQGSTQNIDWQGDIILTPSFTWGKDKYIAMPAYTFNSMTINGLEDDFRHSLSYGLNLIFNTDGRNQWVGSLGFRSGDFSFHTFNDVKVLTFWLGNDDRWWTGGGRINILTASKNLLSLGTEVFTGVRSRPFRSQNNAFVQPSPQDRNLNNGSTFIQLRWADGSLISSFNLIGSRQMWSQNGVHRLLGYPIFKSSSENLIQLSQGVNLMHSFL
jgi:Bacterial toxin 23